MLHVLGEASPAATGITTSDCRSQSVITHQQHHATTMLEFTNPEVVQLFQQCFVACC
jgi:hypothetical protein